MISTVPSAWSLEATEVLRRLAGDPLSGLSRAESATRLLQFGPNVFAEEKRGWALLRFLSHFKSPVVLILVGAVLLSLFLGEIIDASVIGAILLLNAVVGYLQEVKAESAVAALKQRTVPHARVLRDGVGVAVNTQDICPGDILVLEAGDFVAADARLFIAHQLACDESVLTGESLPVEKQTEVVPQETPLGDRHDMVFGGTSVVKGSGRAVVVATGMQTEMGGIAGLITAAKTHATPLEKRMQLVSTRLVLFCLGVIAVVFALGLYHQNKFIDVLLGAVSLAVAAIPEGLPAVVTLALALAVRRMVGRNAIVRQLAAVETLGSTHVICTDKTGTLTTGKMRVSDVWIDGRLSLSPNQELLEAGILCSNASLSVEGVPTGDPTEVALLILARDHGIDLHATTVNHPRLFEWAFDSERKRMGVAVGKGDKTMLYVKGAPESVIELCKLDAAMKTQIEEAIQMLSSQGKRLLAVASREITKQSFSSSTSLEQDLQFLGLVALADPARPEAKLAVAACQKAGIVVVMITGDHPITAKAIAKELGLVSADFDGVLSGTDLDRLSDIELSQQVTRTAVYARVTPAQKIRIVRAWKAHDKVVAMTGDGVNDAPAIKEASIGIAMGRSGTEVARQASSMILADDNFATIVAAVEEGRAVHGNIRRTIKYLLSGNFGEILVMLGAAVMGLPIPLFPIHLLWINLVTDGIPALALASEPVPKNYLESSERSSLDSFRGFSFYREIIFTGFVTGLLTLIIYWYALKNSSEAVARTHAFSFLVFEELFRSFACRSETKIFWQTGVRANLALLIAVILPVSFQLVLHHFPLFHGIFKIVALDLQECLVLMGLALIPVTILEMKKILR